MDSSSLTLVPMFLWPEIDGRGVCFGDFRKNGVKGQLTIHARCQAIAQFKSIALGKKRTRFQTMHASMPHLPQKPGETFDDSKDPKPDHGMQGASRRRA